MFEFDIAISYAGEEEGLASDLAMLLEEKKQSFF
jgi:hypothetical protein